MANLWTLKFGKDETLPILVRSGTNVGSNISFLTNTVYKSIQDQPTDPIDVNNDFPWTKSPKSSRRDVPTIRLKEKRITKNSTVSNLAYSLLANADLANTLSVQAGQSVDILTGNEKGEATNFISNLKSNAADQVNKIVKESEVLTNIKGKVNEVFDFESFQSNVLKPYNFLYATEKTGFDYIFPYLDNNYRESNVSMGTDQSNIASSVMGAVRGFAQEVAGATLALRPGVYIEESRQFSMGQEGRSLNVSIPLLNTGSYDEILKNWQLIFGLIYQNRPGRITKNLVDVPVIYETSIEGMAYMPYSYIRSLSIEFVGNRRTMKMKVPVTKFSTQGSDIGIQTREITTVIPDAFQLNFTITGLNDETRNFLFESIDKNVVTAKVAALGNPDLDNNINEVTNGGPINGGDLIMEGQYQDNIKDLPDLELYRYENIFKVYQTGKKNYYYYNILKKIKISENLNNSFFDFIVLNRNLPLTTVSYELYGTTYLWWLILVVNKIQNPVKNLPAGKKIRFVKNKFLKDILDNIKNQLV